MSELFIKDMERHPWLRMLLDAYNVIDKGVNTAIRRHQKKRGTLLACKRGCGNCCLTHRDIPVYPLELVGIYWYCIEKVKDPLRSEIKKNLILFNKGNSCPFLINNECGIHSVRPIACRQFNVFGKPCEKEEDPYYTRRDDVLEPLKEYTDRAFMIMLPFYGINDDKSIKEAIKTGYIHTHVRVLQELEWNKLALRMDNFEQSL